MRLNILLAAVVVWGAGACGGGDNGLFAPTSSTGGQDGGGGEKAGAAGDDGGSCTSECVAGELRCAQDRVQTCTAGVKGCAKWDAPTACPSEKPFCSNGSCAATCVDECKPTGSRACAADGVRTCGQLDTDPCLDWSAVLPCGPGEVCRSSDATCVLDCGGKACPCTAGETRPCDELGECKGGTRPCVNGEFGACQWQQGPKNEQCDGKDNDCDGTVDNNLVATPCAKQAGVCNGAVQSCAGAQGWSACTDANYASYATGHGHVYESVETSCDGQDNDCNGKVDEPTNCCQPNCAGKVCGADDGCGYGCQGGTCGGAQEKCVAGKCVCQPDCSGKACGAPDGCGKSCQVGSCGPNSACNQGTCACTNVPCNGTCCAQAEVCASGACCTPQCGARVCGPDPVCGQSCGSCPAITGGNLESSCEQGACVVQCKPGTSLCKGQCQAGSCSWTDNLVGDSDYTPDNIALDVDSGGGAHVSFVLGDELFYAAVNPTLDPVSVESYPGCESYYNRHPSAVSIVPPRKFVACEVKDSSLSTYMTVFVYEGSTWTSIEVQTLDSIYEVNDIALLGERLAYSVWHTEYNTPGFQDIHYTTRADNWSPDFVDTHEQNAKKISLFLGAGNKPSVAYPNWSAFPSSSLSLATLNGASWTTQSLAGAPTGNDVTVAAGPKGELAAAQSSPNGITYYSQATGWTEEVVDASAAWANVEMLVDANGIPHIAYATEDGVKLATKIGASWQIEVVDSNPAEAVAIRMHPNGQVVVASADSSTDGGVWVWY